MADTLPSPSRFEKAKPDAIPAQTDPRILRRLLGNAIGSTSQLREYESESVRNTLDNSFVPKLIQEARFLQDEFLRSRFEGKPLSIADIGCGDGYHGEIFAPDCIAYDGFEISEVMAKKTNDRWAANGFKNAKVLHCDAGSFSLRPNTYDIAWSLYFTSGNFRDELPLEQYTNDYLDRNPAFIRIASNFHNALKPGGSLLLTVYKDIPETEEAQHTFYEKTGQTLITRKGSRFVATQENFWSVRWTRESMLSNLKACGIESDQVLFHELNGISWIVEIKKR